MVVPVRYRAVTPTFFPGLHAEIRRQTTDKTNPDRLPLLPLPVN